MYIKVKIYGVKIKIYGINQAHRERVSGKVDVKKLSRV
jgi:hypothetical protein